METPGITTTPSARTGNPLAPKISPLLPGSDAGWQDHRYPAAVAASLLYVKQLYPPSPAREVVRIVQRTFGSKTHPHTVKALLARHASPWQLAIPLLAFAELADAYPARWPVIQMGAEGWHKKRSAGCRKMARSPVEVLMAAFERAGFAGLEDHRAQPSPHLETPGTLPFLQEVLDRQQASPRAGRFRLHGVLAQQHGPDLPSAAPSGRAMAINRRVHGAPGPQRQGA